MTPHPHNHELAERLAARLTEVSVQLQYAQTELRELRRSLGAQAAVQREPIAPATAVAPPATPVSSPRQATVPVKPPWWEREGVVSRVLAVAGAALTLAGIVLLLVLAAQAGYFGPVARVAAGAVIALALIGAGWRVADRPGGKVGAVALASTGVAGLYLDVLAVTAIYEWLPAAAGLGAALVIAGSGLTLALRWESQLLAMIIVLGSVTLAPFLTEGLTPLLVAFYLALLAASFPVQYRRDWPPLLVARTLPIAFAILIAYAFVDAAGSDAPSLLAASIVFAILGGGGAVLVSHRYRESALPAAMTATAVVPLFFSGTVSTMPVYVTLMALLATAAALSLALVRALPAATRIVLGAIAALAVLCGLLAASAEALRPLVVLGLALTSLAVAKKRGSTLARWSGYFYGATGLILYVDAVPPEVLFDAAWAANVAQGPAIAASVALLAVALAAPMPTQDGVWVLAGLAGLYALSTGAVLAGVLLAGEDAGFRGGHATATVLWMLSSIGLLVLALRHRTRTALAGAGLTLAALAVTKLLVFDLAALDGFYRVLTFLAVGVLLLAAGTRYARAYAERPSGDDRPVVAAPQRQG